MKLCIESKCNFTSCGRPSITGDYEAKKCSIIISRQCLRNVSSAEARRNAVRRIRGDNARLDRYYRRNYSEIKKCFERR
jgi:hypothetical protein